MSAESGPRLTSGIIASVLFHGALVAALFTLRPPPPPAEPPMYSVQLIAAPAGAPAAGVVQDTPPTPAPQPPAPAPTPAPPATTAPVMKTKVVPPKKHSTPKPAAEKATPATPTATPKKKEAPKKEDAPQPIAGGGPKGGKGADVANIDTPGIDFPYPAYTTNIVSQLIRRFGAMQGTLSASVRFVIRRDGSVDLASVQIVTPSGSYPFDLRAVGAVESAVKANAFGPLPPGFREDILPVTFRFSPSPN